MWILLNINVDRFQYHSMYDLFQKVHFHDHQIHNLWNIHQLFHTRDFIDYKDIYIDLHNQHKHLSLFEIHLRLIDQHHFC